MTRATYYDRHRLARLGNLGTLAATTSSRVFQWFLREVYDLRFPHVGDDRRRVDELIKNGAFNSARFGGSTQQKLAAWHRARGWLNCGHKSLLRLWVEYLAVEHPRRFKQFMANLQKQEAA